MRTCPKCGKEIEDEARFCSSCGFSMEDAAKDAPESETKTEADEKAEVKEAEGAAGPGTNGPQGPYGPGFGPNGPQGQFGPGPGPNGPRGPYGPGPGPNGPQGPYGPGFGPNGPQGPYQQPYQAYDPKDHTSDFDPADIEENKLFAAMPYFLGIVGVIAALLVHDSPFTRYHIKHELRFLIISVLACVPLVVPIVGWIVGGIALTIIGVLKIIAMVWVLQGKAKDIPLISSIGFLR